MLAGIVLVVLAVLNINGGFMSSIEALANVQGDSSIPGAYISFFGPLPVDLMGVIILTSLGTWGLPQMVQKFYAIKHEDSIRKGTIISTIFAVVVAGGCYFLGGFGRLFMTQEEVTANGFDSIIPTMLESLPDMLVGIVIVLVLSASMSTLSALVLTSSSTLTLDIIDKNIVKNMSEKGKLLWVRLLVVAFIAISAVIAIIQFNSSVTFIAQLMGVSWGALAGAFLAPFLYGLYWKGTTKLSCYVCFSFASIIMILNLFFRSSFPTLLQSPINCGAFTMIAGLLIVPIVSLISPKPDRKLVEDTFSCYNKEVVAQAKTSLED